MNSNILDHIFTLSISVVSSGFIGSSSKICTVGNISTKSNLKEHRTEIIDKDSSSKLASVDMNGLCSAAEICGDVVNGGLYLATAYKSSRFSKIMFSELIEQSASSETGYDILPRLSLDPIENESSNITSLCFSAPQGLLAAGFESGLITMYDIQSGSLLNSFQSDAAGINQVKFDRKGNLVSVGNSTSQLKVWDLRSLTSIASRKYSESDYNLTALCPHSVNDTIYCGTSSGSVLCWDLRSHDDFIIQNTLHSEPVSSLILHPSIRGSIISASYDGAVISTDFNNTNSSQMNTDGSMNEHYESYACTILMQDYAPVTCLDVHSGTRSLLAGTATGAIWLKSFERNAGSVSN